MLKFSLMKGLYFQLDPGMIKEAKETRSFTNCFRTIPISVPDEPDITSMTMEERCLPYSMLFYLYVNDEKEPSDITELRIKRLVLTFLRAYLPDSIVKEVPEDLTDVNILDYLDPYKLPTHPPSQAYLDYLALKENHGKEE